MNTQQIETNIIQRMKECVDIDDLDYRYVVGALQAVKHSDKFRKLQMLNAVYFIQASVITDGKFMEVTDDEFYKYINRILVANGINKLDPDQFLFSGLYEGMLQHRLGAITHLRLKYEQQDS